MFSSLGLFKDTGCPQGVDCMLINCIFSHMDNYPQDSSTDTVGSGGATVNQEDLYDPLMAGGMEVDVEESLAPPAAKRRRVDDALPREETEVRLADEDSQRGRGRGVEQEGRNGSRQTLLDSSSSTFQSASTSSQHASTPTPRAVARPSQAAVALPSITRPVSPPNTTRQVKKVIESTTVAKKKKVEGGITATTTTSTTTTLKLPIATLEAKPRPKEPLNPRLVSKAPESHAVRLALLKRVHDSITTLNNRVSKDGTAVKNGDAKHNLTLLPDELIRLALDEEEQIAIQNPDKDLYRQVIGRRIMVLRKMQLVEWKKLILDKFKEKYVPPQTGTAKDANPSKEQPILTGLTAREEIVMLQHIRTPLEGLEAHGYVTSPPADAEIAAARKGVEAAAGFEKCDRCGNRFQVYPGRDDQGRLTSGGRCRFHWARVYRPMRQKTDGVTGQQEAIYPCCKGPLGSDGCTEAETHVYKVTETKRLASVLQFERTPEPREQDRKSVPVAFDCEMGFTTLGMELIRLTAVSWPQGQELLDVLVRPMGEVLDLNTRFSGVSKEQFANAIPYDMEPSDHGDSTSEEGEMEAAPLKKVASPAAARQLLFELLTPATPLIGHAIDNDLNVCRIIHPTIVDTVLLFPHPRGLPARYGLKMLTHKYFDRGIQMGGALGHDSREDARATGDLVRFKVGEKWRQMKGDGWQFDQDGRLCGPDDEAEAEIVSVSGSCSGSKRSRETSFGGAETGRD